MNLDFEKLNGLIPAIIQDADSLQILMLGFMNEEALQKTKETNKVTFFSRSKNRLWQKGETSGNFLEVVEIKTDCDNDTLLITAHPKGPTCHTGTQTCFGSKTPRNFLAKLAALINDRKKSLPEDSYTTSLFKEGLNKITKKVNEESMEVIVAAKSETRERLVEESADLLYHLLVLLAEKNVDLSEVEAELEKRHH